MCVRRFVSFVFLAAFATIPIAADQRSLLFAQSQIANEMVQQMNQTAQCRQQFETEHQQFCAGITQRIQQTNIADPDVLDIFNQGIRVNQAEWDRIRADHDYRDALARAAAQKCADIVLAEQPAQLQDGELFRYYHEQITNDDFRQILRSVLDSSEVQYMHDLKEHIEHFRGKHEQALADPDNNAKYQQEFLQEFQTVDALMHANKKQYFDTCDLFATFEAQRGVDLGTCSLSLKM